MISASARRSRCRHPDVFAPGQPVRALDGATSLLDSGLRSGSRVELTAWTSRPRATAVKAVALLEVVTGPDVGSQFALPSGVRRHRSGSRFRHRVQRSVSVEEARPHHRERHRRDHRHELRQRGRDGRRAGAHATLSSADVVVLGDTPRDRSGCTPLAAPPSGRRSSSSTGRPGWCARYPGDKYPAPAPPRRPQPQRFPIVALDAPR